MTGSASAREIQPQNPQRDEFLNDVVTGLNTGQKTLNPKYFYDDKGSRLFQQITELPEYYITRTETEMMRKIAAEITDRCGDTNAVVEFGSGSGMRTDILLSALPCATCYVPIDVSEELLASTERDVKRGHPNIDALPLVADFTVKLRLPGNVPLLRLGYFPGSTIGNFLPGEAIGFMENARHALGTHSKMLLGVDLSKSVDRIESAYNDAEGVTAQFNKNILIHINESLDADFVIDNFEHRAFFNRAQSRIEMHLVSLSDQRVSIDGRYDVEFRPGETIHTENSHKYTIDGFGRLARMAGWTPMECWVDDENLFSIHLLQNR